MGVALFSTWWNVGNPSILNSACGSISRAEKMVAKHLVPFLQMDENSIPFIEKIKKVLVGGSPVQDTLKEKILNSKSIIYETYGMTETITHIAARNLSMGEKEFTTLPGIEIGEKDNCLFIKPNHLSIEMVQTNDIVQFTNKNKFLLIGRRDFIICLLYTSDAADE